ncbi:P-loop containing nucleoside triphosphate hydrolase protein, partial [Lactarius quietus]
IQSKHFSFARGFFSAPSDNPALIGDDHVVSVSSEQVDAPSSVAMGAIQTSLAALQVGSTFAANIPYIAPVAGLLLQTLTMRDAMKQCKEECKIVMQKVARIANIVVNIGNSCEKYNLSERDLPDGLRTILGSLQRELDGVDQVLKKCAKAKGVKGFLLRKDLVTKIKQCDGELSNVLEAVLLELSLDNRFAQIAEAREATGASNTAEEFPTIPREPNAPQIFFGREAELDQIIHMVFSNIASYPAQVAILGPGGYGKTTLAHAVLTHERVREHFGDTRHFVTCESIFSSEALLIELGKTLGVLDGAPNALWSRICSALSFRETILCLDNFESPWDQSSGIKHSVEELLSRITVLHQVTILITMRGAERPAKTKWSQPFLEPLGIFGHTAAKQVWQAIAGNYDEFSEKLSAAVDCVPLAVDLLAHLSQMTPPMLLSNMDYSIQLSIDSARMRANPSAKNLLGVLSMLSDGLHMRHLKIFQGRLIDMDIISCLQTLQKCSLIKLTDERYQLHPIIRHFCENQGIILSAHKIILEDLYITLASLPYSDSHEAYGEMNFGVNYKKHFELIIATIDFTWFMSEIGNHSDEVISQTVQFVQKNHGDKSLLIKSLTAWGGIYYQARDFVSAQEKLKEAEKWCLQSHNVNGHIYGNVLVLLGNTYASQDAINDSMDCYQRALKVYKKSHNKYDISETRQLDEAVTLQQNALQCYENIDDNVGQGNAYRDLGEIYIRQKKHLEAEAAIQNALKLYETSNSIL